MEQLRKFNKCPGVYSSEGDRVSMRIRCWAVDFKAMGFVIHRPDLQSPLKPKTFGWIAELKTEFEIGNDTTKPDMGIVGR